MKKNFLILFLKKDIERGHIHTISYKNYHKNQLFSREQKFDYVAKQIKLFEKVIEDNKPDLVFCFQRFFYLDLVCNKKKLIYFTLHQQDLKIYILFVINIITTVQY